jgi:hypothetical protein
MGVCSCARARAGGGAQVPRSQATSTLAAFDWPSLYGSEHAPAALRPDTVPAPDGPGHKEAPAAASPAE